MTILRNLYVSAALGALATVVMAVVAAAITGPGVAARLADRA